MAMKIKDEDPKKKKKAVAKKPAAQSSVMVQPSRPMGKYAGGLPNSNFKSPPRTTVAVGPATFPVGKRTEKSTGGIDYSKGEVKTSEKKGSNTKTSGAKAGNKGTGTAGWNTYDQDQAAKQKAAGKTSGRIAIGIGSLVTGAGIGIALRKNKEKRQAKRAARKESRAERKSGVMIVEPTKKKK
jgi:hypothetical protein